MQNTDSIINVPIFIGLLLSLGIHAAVLNRCGAYTPTMPQLDTGRTVVHLTLIPSRTIQSSQADTDADAAPESDLAYPERVETTNAMAAAVAVQAAIEQHATPATEEGVVTEAAATGGFKPAYPRISKNRGEEGTVSLAVQVRADGSVDNVEIVQSSGYRRLDAAAVKGVYKTTFQPATRHGDAVEATAHLSYTFKLTDD